MIFTPFHLHKSFMMSRMSAIKVVTMDAGYKTPWICKRILEDRRIPSLPYKRPMTKKGNPEWWKYVYDEYYDCVICPEYSILTYSTTNRNGYREYKSDPNVCRNCPTRHLCTASKNCQKLVSLHIWRDFAEQAEDIRHTPLGKKTYAKRKKTIERVFADAKEKYAMRYTPYRGLTAVTNWVKLKYAAMNLKKFAVHRWKDAHPFLPNLFSWLSRFTIYAKNPIPA